MAKEPVGAKTSPETSMKTEVWYCEEETPTSAKPLTQIFYVQEIPQLVSPKDPVTYSCLESDEEGSAKGMRKAEQLSMPVLYTEEQSDELYALSEGDTAYWFFIKLPDSTAVAEGKPLVYKFKAAIDVANDTISVGDMLKETVTLYKQSKVTRMKGLPTVTA